MLRGRFSLWAVLAVLASGAAPAAEPPSFAWPRPQLLSEIDIPGTSVVNGVPTRLHAIQVKGRPPGVLQIYLDAFTRSGFYLLPASKQPQFGPHPMLTALDTKTLVSYSVIVQGQSDGTSVVLMGEANLGLRQVSPTEEGALPVFPGAKHVLRSRQEGAELVRFQAMAKERELRGFYDQVLKAAGYAPPTAEAGAPPEPGTFVRNGEELRVLVTPAANAPGAHDVLVMSRKGRAARASSSP